MFRRSQSDAMIGSTSSLPGRLAALRKKLTSGPEPAAADQAQPLDTVGEQVEQLHHDAAAERVAHERRRRQVQVIHQVAQGGGVGAE